MKMRHAVALGAFSAAFAFGTSAVLAQGSMSTKDTTPATYEAAKAAGQAAQKVAPPNLVLPADMGGGTWAQHNGNSMNNGTTTNGTVTAPPNGQDNGTPANTGGSMNGGASGTQPNGSNDSSSNSSTNNPNATNGTSGKTTPPKNGS